MTLVSVTGARRFGSETQSPDAGSSHSSRTCAEAQRGFSLLETLVAFSVLAICLGVMLRVFGGGGRAAVLTNEYARATTVAESFLAALGTEKELTLGREEGSLAGGLRWMVAVEPLPVQQSEQISAMNFAFMPLWVEVTVSWGHDETRSIKLSTVRLLANQNGGLGGGAGSGGGGAGGADENSENAD